MTQSATIRDDRALLLLSIVSAPNDQNWFLSAVMRQGDKGSTVELFSQRSSAGRWCLTEMSLVASRSGANWNAVDSWLLENGLHDRLDLQMPGRIHEVLRRIGTGLNVHLLLNWIHQIERRDRRLTSLRTIDWKDVLDDWENIVQSFIGLDMIDEALTVLSPSVILGEDEWSMVLGLLAHGEISNEGLDELIWALAFGERWQQVKNPETATSTGG